METLQRATRRGRGRRRHRTRRRGRGRTAGERIAGNLSQKAWAKTGWWHLAFLIRLGTTGSVAAAAAAAGVARSTVYLHRRTREGFAAGWGQALVELADSAHAPATAAAANSGG